MPDKRLGKGLEALITTHSTEDSERFLEGAVSIDKIIPNRNQPRQEFNLEKNLSQSGNYSLALSLLVLSLFIQIRYITPILMIRPFDILTILIFLYWMFSESNKK